MSGFLDYLENFNSKITHKESIKTVEKTRTVESSNKNNLIINSQEIDSIEKAKLLVEKIQNWILKQEGIIEKNKVEEKSTYKIPSKKIIKNPLHETRSHAMDILDGLPDEIVINPIINEQNYQDNINNLNNPCLETVSSHASALL